KRPGGDVISGRRTAINEIFDVGEMHRAAPACHAKRFAQEGRLLCVALDQVHQRVVSSSQHTGKDNPWKAASAAEGDPGPSRRSDVEELQRVGNVARPE